MMLRGGRRSEVPCVLDIAQTQDSLHAHAIPQAVEIGPGDTVLVNGAPRRIGFGKRMRIECTATVTHAGPFGRAWARCNGMFALCDLFEVGFQRKEPS
jgi:hypothetical protein